METVILIICLFIASISLGVLCGVLILYRMDDANNKKMQTNFPNYGGYGVYTAMGTVPVQGNQIQGNSMNQTQFSANPAYAQFGSQTSYGRMWHVEMWNYEEGKVYSKNFSGQIVLGRQTSANELFWQMQVGATSSISREQCIIYDRDGLLIIENLSKVNPTLLNNMPLSYPVVLNPGAQLTMGTASVYVSAIQRVA